MITQLHGDNLDILPTLAPGSVQTIVTSPPYFGLRSYSIPPSAWPEVIYQPLIGLPPVVIPAMVCQLGAEPDPLAYIAHLVHVFRLARVALRDDGTLWVNLADSYGGERGNKTPAPQTKWAHAGADTPGSSKGDTQRKQLLGIPHRAALALQADGWVWRSEVIWHAPNKMPESVRDRPTRAHEQVLLFGKGPRYYYDSEAVAEEATATENRGGGHTVQAQVVAPGALNDGFNARWQPTGTRNKRTVWSIPTTPMPSKLRGASDAHYAAWPPALVEVMIKASTANKACAACGAAWVRQVEREDQGWDGSRYGEKAVAATGGAKSGGTARSTLGSSNGKSTGLYHTTGFVPACTCAAGIGRCVVLDPFGGTGTTGAVAEQLGRDAILIDLGYQELQAKRTDNLQIAMEAYL